VALIFEKMILARLVQSYIFASNI